MRKALLVLAMVAASFAGGAAVNGPGLAWLRATVGLDPARIEPIDSRRLPDPDQLDKVEPEANASSPGPAFQRLGRLDDEDEADDEPPPARRPTTPAAPARPEVKEAGPDIAPPRPLDLTGTTRPASATAEAKPEPARPSGVPTLDLAAPAPEAQPSQPGWGDPPGAAPARALPAPAASAPRLDPAVAPAELTAPALLAPGTPAGLVENPAPAAPEPEAESDDLEDSADPDWAAIAARLAERGVTRFWIEGEPDGPARFRCVVPLTGRGALSQHFEAEADDPAAAAEAALRRIDLWRAAETP